MDMHSVCACRTGGFKMPCQTGFIIMSQHISAAQLH
jgi:hypothetical protein